MRLDDLRPSDNVEDRRGQGGGFGPRMVFGGGGWDLSRCWCCRWCLASIPPSC